MPKKKSPARVGNAKKKAVVRQDTVSATEEERASDNQERVAEAVKANRVVTPTERTRYLNAKKKAAPKKAAPKKASKKAAKKAAKKASKKAAKKKK